MWVDKGAEGIPRFIIAPDKVEGKRVEVGFLNTKDAKGTKGKK